jgi:hypothetical protein
MKSQKNTCKQFSVARALLFKNNILVINTLAKEKEIRGKKGRNNFNTLACKSNNWIAGSFAASSSLFMSKSEVNY